VTHKRTAIRSALVSALTGLATTGSHVYASRLRPLTATDLPAILVSTGGEDFGDEYMKTGLPVQRDLRILLEIVVKAVVDYEATADTILGEIEAALFTTHSTLGGNALSVSLASIDDPEMDDSTDKPVVRLAVILRVTYSS
jgi:hypothetical protein